MIPLEYLRASSIGKVPGKLATLSRWIVAPFIRCKRDSLGYFEKSIKNMKNSLSRVVISDQNILVANNTNKHITSIVTYIHRCRGQAASAAEVGK